MDHSRIQSLYGELHDDNDTNEISEISVKRKCEYICCFFFHFIIDRIFIAIQCLFQ